MAVVNVSYLTTRSNTAEGAAAVYSAATAVAAAAVAAAAAGQPGGSLLVSYALLRASGGTDETH